MSVCDMSDVEVNPRYTASALVCLQIWEQKAGFLCENEGRERGYEARTQTFHNLSDPFDTSKVTHSIAEKRKPKISFLNVVRKKHDENWI